MKSYYAGKKVFVTGHTGFKGAWLCWWLLKMGAEVTGYALPPEDKRGNLYNLTGLANKMKSIEASLDDLDLLTKSLIESQAEIVFHLAAQPLVLTSYLDPVETYRTNVMGTVHMLDAIKNASKIKTAVIITTDKCYDNKEWDWPYRETDALGGYDTYSSSKAMAELATQAYYKSFLKEKNIGVATARAGNVIGGGDFAEYRIIPDIVESINDGKPVVLRHPEAIRPWQHVLDALYGYLILSVKLSADPEKYSTSFNFSPDQSPAEYTVEKITNIFINGFKKGEYKIDTSTRKGHEAKFLRLDSSRANSMLGWKPVFDTEEAINETVSWYKDFVEGNDILQKTLFQIDTHLEKINNG